MPNNSKLPLCPYYIADKRITITCEDVLRGFPSIRKKVVWMSRYCCRDWHSCPYAADLTRMYERIEKGADMEKEKMEQKIKALDKELRSKTMLVGRRDKKIARMQKKIDELRTHNTALMRNNNTYYSKWRKAEAKIRASDEKVGEQLARMGIIYEQRMAYLIENFAPGKEMKEKDVEDWAKDKAIAIVHKGSGEALAWTVKYIVKQDTEEDEVKSDGSADNDLQRTEKEQ